MHKTPHYWEDGKEWLSKADPVMARIIADYPGEALKSRGDAFYTLARSIVGQQISVKAADSMWKKLESRVRSAQFGDEKEGEGQEADSALYIRHSFSEGGSSPHGECRSASRRVNVYVIPEIIVELSEEDLRTCGLSRQKVTYLKSLAGYFLAQERDDAFWQGLSDQEIIKELTGIKGIGVWTAEMFLIFYALRPDVFSLGDIGLLKAVELHYGEPETTSSKKYANKEYYAELSNAWLPYRTVASWYLWRSLDPLPVVY